MYLTRFVIENIRAIRRMEWEIPLQSAPGWHVILGDNGSGKSSVLRSIALGLVGPAHASALRQDWARWVRWEHEGQAKSSIEMALVPDLTFDKFSKGKPRKPLPVEFGVGFYHFGGESFVPIAYNNTKQSVLERWRDPTQSIWDALPGWFCASYGPFRRFTGGNKDYEKLFAANPQLARHLSVFDESVALTEGLQWLQQLQFKKLEGEPEGALLEPLKKFINQPGFLPHHARLVKITSKEVLFVDGNGYRVPVEELSDGYRSILHSAGRDDDIP